VNFQGQNERHPTVDEFSVEAWFRTASTQGGRILGFGNSNSGNSGSGTSDRHLYVTNNGRVMFGVRTRAEGTGFTSSRVNRTIESAPGLNNGQWHHVVGTLASGGMRLYVDGVQVASRNDLNSGHGYYGYWRVGADTLSGWTSLPSSTRLNGDIDEAAVYYHALNGTQAEQHFALGRGLTPGNVAPTASFTAQASNLTVQVNGSGSSDPDGTITSYAWNFGDGGTATGATASHSYAAAGTYTVTLTVTDNQGAVGQNSQPVTVTAPAANVPPTASFTHETSGLELSVNASGSSDPDGTIESYGWNFGDGGTGTGTTASHTYAAAGTYTVTLTVTDDDGATDADSKPVTVTEPGAPVVLAADGFGRQVTNGLGIADVGGAWTTTGSTTNYAVVGGVGTHRMQVAGSETSSFLSNVSGRDVVAAVDLAFDKPPTGSGVYVTLAVRRVGTSDYRVGVRASPTSTSVTLYRLQNTSTTLAAVNVPGLVYASGDVLRVEFAAVGNGSTSLGAKVWRLGSAEPAAWQVTAVDTTPALQGAGGVGLVSYLSGSSTNAPLTARYDNLLVTEGG
jgi:PKD repeat protein